VVTVDLEVTSRADRGWSIVEASGEVDVFTAPKLRGHLTGLIEQGRSRLVVDLHDVPFMDSTGLGVLIGTLRRVKERDGDLRLVCEEGPVLRVLDITGLSRLFAIFASAQEATAEG
jgi:anti-sigma B factor antagonist